MDNQKAVMIFIDAFSSNYLNKDNAPFLYKLHLSGYCKKVVPLPAFEGIGTTVFSGTWPITNGVWTNFVRKQTPDKIHNLFLYSLFKITDQIPNNRLAWDFRYIIYKLNKIPIPIPNHIPPSLLKYFESKLKSSIFAKNALDGIPTLFDIIRMNGKTTKQINQSIFSSDEKIADNAIKYLRQKDLAYLTYIKFSSLDPIGHKFGPMSKRTLERVEVIDTLVEKIVDTASDNPNVTFLIFSDHGMAPISYHFNLIKLLQKTSLEIGKDYLLFLDSTMARFWFRDQQAFRIIETMLSDLDYGYLLSEHAIKNAKLPLNNDEYGDLIFALNEGNVFCPDFFHRNKALKGMHSYFISKYDQPILAIYPSSGFNINTNGIRFVDIMPTILKILEISCPKSCEGKSIIM